MRTHFYATMQRESDADIARKMKRSMSFTQGSISPECQEYCDINSVLSTSRHARVIFWLTRRSRIIVIGLDSPIFLWHVRMVFGLLRAPCVRKLADTNSPTDLRFTASHIYRDRSAMVIIWSCVQIISVVRWLPSYIGHIERNLCPDRLLTNDHTFAMLNMPQTNILHVRVALASFHNVAPLLPPLVSAMLHVELPRAVEGTTWNVRQQRHFLNRHGLFVVVIPPELPHSVWPCACFHELRRQFVISAMIWSPRWSE
jgi:hypothetical protein